MSRPLTAKEAQVFFNQLHAMYDSGLALEQSLALLAHTATGRRLRSHLPQVLKAVRSGKELSFALNSLGLVTPLQYRLLQLGEASGNMDTVLVNLGREAEKRVHFQRTLLSQLGYPVFLFFAALVILPLPELVTYGVRTYLLHAVLPVGILVALFGLLFAFRRQFGESAAVRETVDPILIRLPLIGPLVRHLAWARFCRAFALALSSGLDILATARLSLEAMDNRSLRYQARGLEQALQAGKSLSGHLDEALPLPAFLREMLVTGETTGRLDVMMHKSADYLEEQSEFRLKVLTRALGIAAFLAAAAYIGYKVIAFYSDYFGQLDRITR